METGLRTVDLAETAGELLSLTRARRDCANVLTTLGDVEEAQKHASAGLEAAEYSRTGFALSTSLFECTRLAILKGDWETARGPMGRAAAETPSDAQFPAARAFMHFYLGDPEENGGYIDQVLHVVPDVVIGAGQQHAFAASIIPLFATVTGAIDQLDLAQSLARQVIEAPSTCPYIISMARIGPALIAVQRADVEAAKEQYRFIGEHHGKMLPWSVLAADHVLGLLAQTMGKFDDAAAHFDDALAFCRKAGYRPELASSCHDYAALRRARGQRVESLALLDEVMTISTELGMGPLIDRVRSMRETLTL